MPDLEHGGECVHCGTYVPAGTPQHHITGAGPTCEPCGKRGRESFFRWKRSVAESWKWAREAEQLQAQKDDYAWEGGSVGPTYECLHCGEDYHIDRPPFYLTYQHFCETCEHIHVEVYNYALELRKKHGQRFGLGVFPGPGPENTRPRPRRSRR